jgi:hypothetical protein
MDVAFFEADGLGHNAQNDKTATAGELDLLMAGIVTKGVDIEIGATGNGGGILKNSFHATAIVSGGVVFELRNGQPAAVIAVEETDQNFDGLRSVNFDGLEAAFFGGVL